MAYLIIVFVWSKPHCHKHLHDQLLNALFVVDSSNHFDTNVGNFVVRWKLNANVAKDFDDTFTHRNTRVLKRKESFIAGNSPSKTSPAYQDSL